MAAGRVRSFTHAVLSCLTVQPTWPQFKDLATTDDGLQLYFASPLLLKGANEYDSYKIFRYVDSHFELFASSEAQRASAGRLRHALGTPQVSGDGRIGTHDGTSTCTGIGVCIGSYKVRGTIVGATIAAWEYALSRVSAGKPRWTICALVLQKSTGRRSNACRLGDTHLNRVDWIYIDRRRHPGAGPERHRASPTSYAAPLAQRSGTIAAVLRRGVNCATQQ